MTLLPNNRDQRENISVPLILNQVNWSPLPADGAEQHLVKMLPLRMIVLYQQRLQTFKKPYLRRKPKSFLSSLR